MIKLRFLDESGIFPHLIKMWTWSALSHVEFVFDDGYLGADYPGGVQIQPFDYASPKKQWIGIVNCDDEISKKVEAFARSQIGKPYSILGIVGFIIKHDFNKKGSWFCSEFVYAAFEESGFDILGKMDIDRISPRDLFYSPLVQIQGDAQ